MSCSVDLHSECCLNIIESKIVYVLQEISTFLISLRSETSDFMRKNPINVTSSFVTPKFSSLFVTSTSYLHKT